MKPHGILFNGAMVRAILDGRKTQTRRIVKSNLAGELMIHERECDRVAFFGTDPNNPCNHTFCFGVVKAPHGPVGRKLWVRETWQFCDYDGPGGYPETDIVYRADGETEDKRKGWIPSIHMPQWAARIWLEVTEIRCQRLQDISEVDARAEGVSVCRMDVIDAFLESDEPARLVFRDLWESINGPGSWDANPWVWAYTFKRIKKP